MTWRAQGHVLGIQESRSPGGNTCLTWRAQGTHQVPLQPGCCLAISLLPGQALSRDSVEAEMIQGFCHLGRVQPCCHLHPTGGIRESRRQHGHAS